MDKQTFCSSQTTSNTSRYAAALYRQGMRDWAPVPCSWRPVGDRSRMGAGMVTGPPRLVLDTAGARHLVEITDCWDLKWPSRGASGQPLSRPTWLGLLVHRHTEHNFPGRWQGFVFNTSTSVPR